VLEFLSGTSGKIDPDEIDLPSDEDLPPANIGQAVNEWLVVNRNAEAQENSLDERCKLNLTLNFA
jgi:hypothetical protein